MRSYATDSPEWQKVTLRIGIISVAIDYVIHWFFQTRNVQIPWWVDAPGVLGIAGGLYEVFEKWLWTIPLLRSIGIVKVPNLNGEWKLQGWTKWSRGQDYQGEAVIKQTWTRISICIETEQSSSKSITASLLVNEDEGITLIYVYRNDPKANVPTTMHSHRGTAVLRLKDDCLEGEYYSGRDRQNFGTLILRRKGDAR
ncbi:hypothetical protein CTKA_01142 [Chthonomonas calidirosea]|uniref:Uncharacterized protein n=1 Tax=Chthonomonas calidirosea (strain DSM 23976 / ICMP 18418 / T49) TaxID=1303518 RepID=S0ESK1_CHTCT|nr:hypothetical protein CCALI_00014 [Chthonomonas calidirosea T49]CEK16465.1 hypothetical protein CTKA_01142 [Chthonomonas calidirosea]